MSRPADCLSDLRIDRLLVGELDELEARAARGHAAACMRCAARLAALDADRAAFVAAPPLCPAIARRRRRHLPAAIAAVAAAAAALAVLVPRVEPPSPAGVRLKGSGGLGVFVARGDAVQRLAPGAVVHPGDRVQLTFSADSAGYLAVVSLDGAGRASAYFPPGPTAAAFGPAHDQPLATSVVLDGALGRERLFAVFCDEPVAVADLLRAPGDAAPAGCRVAAFELDKREAVP